MKISDIFYSLQGEGRFTGKPAIFIRFYGCNLKCSFCDEPLHQSHFEELDDKKIIEQVESYPGQFIVITGGEPTLQNLNPFITKLKNMGYYIAVETNGYKLDNISEANWITYSPKDWKEIKSPEKVDEFKFVVNIKSDLKPIIELSETFKGPLYIQPEGKEQNIVSENINFCIDFVKNNPVFTLSLQTHKLLDIP